MKYPEGFCSLRSSSIRTKQTSLPKNVFHCSNYYFFGHLEDLIILLYNLFSVFIISLFRGCLEFTELKQFTKCNFIVQNTQGKLPRLVRMQYFCQRPLLKLNEGCIVTPSTPPSHPSSMACQNYNILKTFLVEKLKYFEKGNIIILLQGWEFYLVFGTVFIPSVQSYSVLSYCKVDIQHV